MARGTIWVQLPDPSRYTPGWYGNPIVNVGQRVEVWSSFYLTSMSPQTSAEYIKLIPE